MNIYIASDHRGVDIENEIVSYLQSLSLNVLKTKLEHNDTDDYTDFAFEVGENVVKDQGSLGILLCGTGIGMSIAANKVRGIRAALCGDTYSARVSRAHNNANVLCLGERVIGEHLALDIVDIWLKTGFEGGRHKRRVDIIE